MFTFRLPWGRISSINKRLSGYCRNPLSWRAREIGDLLLFVPNEKAEQ
jgi:hypothetical protein